MKPSPIHCQVCNHNMGRSRVKNGKVRCNNCKTVYTITLVPKRKS